MSSHTDVPCVKTAVVRLKELANRMRSTDFNFHDDDVLNIDKVIEALHELENETKRMHDELETETIKASILRHKLLYLPAKIKAEIMEAVNSARQSNTQSQEDFQDKLEITNANILFCGNRQQQLEKENSVLQPEREQIRQQHEEIISQLNQRMAEKASMQIALNETRDKVRAANQDIVDLEDGILQLKEDLIQERTEARQEKRRLKKAVMTTVEKTKEQKEENLGKKKELDSLQEKLTNTETKLAAVRKSIRRFEGSKSRLEDQERSLRQALAREHKMKEELLKQGRSIAREKAKEEKLFREMKTAFESKIKKLEDEIYLATELNYDLEIRKSEIEHEYNDKLADLHAGACKVALQDNILQGIKLELSNKAEEVGRMQAEIKDMEEQLEVLGESHKSVITQLNKQLEEIRDLLDKERKERMQFQSKKDNVQKDLEDTKATEQKFMQNINKDIQNGKTKHVELSNEGSHLQKELKHDETEITDLQSKLKSVEKEHKKITASMQSKTANLEAEIAKMEQDMEEKRRLLEERTPIFGALEVHFQERTDEYNAMKKNVVVMKNQKSTLEENIIITRRRIEKLVEPVEILQKDIKEKRSDALQQLKTIGKSTKEMEENIYLEGSKLKTVLQNNNQFEEACRKLEEDFIELKQQMAQNDLIKVKLNKELTEAKGLLVESWKSDKLMQETFAERDVNTIDAFGKVVEKTDNRAIKIGDITSHLESELEILSAFLENVSSRRPKGKRSKPKKKRRITKLPYN